MKSKKTSPNGRLHLLDTIRGITLVSMILYHFSWDLVYIVQIPNPDFVSFYESRKGFVWQQSICWSFILLSGFCITLSRKKWRRGLLVFACGALVSAVTLVFVPEDRVIFGVLTFIGSAMLLLAALHGVLEKIPACAGCLVSLYLFYLFRWVNQGFLQLFPGKTVSLPASWYHGLAATYLGFMESGFYSTDYFSLFPWIFLYLCGFYLGRLLLRGKHAAGRIWRFDIPPLSFLGRHSLLIYLLHQPILYMCCILYLEYIR